MNLASNLPGANTTIDKVRSSIHAEVYRHVELLPQPVIDFDEDRQQYSFVENLIILNDKLISYTPEDSARQYFKYFFHGLCQYYLQKQTYVTWLAKASDLRLFPELLPGFIHNIPTPKKRFERILVIISFDDALNVHFKQLHSIHDAITVIVADDDFEPAAMLKSWGAYDQVFIAGHGENRSETYEGHVRLGNKLLMPGMIADAINAHQENPAVLGVFTCGEAFYTMESRSQFDYFIADHQSSVPSFVEMFLYGYLLTYFNSYNVLQAFQAGRLATIFRAKSDPTYKIFTRGVKLQE
ncbi:MAG: hypothetical protein KA166_03460 [Saprospiraceae bacterium]|nr:hypothetical protein [Saprospiraceae bacterium]